MSEAMQNKETVNKVKIDFYYRDSKITPSEKDYLSGHTVEIFNFLDHFGLQRMGINSFSIKDGVRQKETLVFYYLTTDKFFGGSIKYKITDLSWYKFEVDNAETQSTLRHKHILLARSIGDGYYLFITIDNEPVIKDSGEVKTIKQRHFYIVTKSGNILTSQTMDELFLSSGIIEFDRIVKFNLYHGHATKTLS